jgi:integrase
MENLRLREAAPTSVNVTVARRSREYLTDREVERLIEAAKRNRSGHRDATAILVAYRHGLRASEDCIEHRPRVRGEIRHQWTAPLTRRVNVRFGSQADTEPSPCDVRFTPESRLR